jgi:sorting and assembly machinery component 37
VGACRDQRPEHKSDECVPPVSRWQWHPIHSLWKFLFALLTSPHYSDELPALKNGTLWISRYRNIIDYLVKYSAAEWDLDSGLSKLQKADVIA